MNIYFKFVTSGAIIKLGDIVTVKNDATTYKGEKLAEFVYSPKYNVTELVRDRVIISYD